MEDATQSGKAPAAETPLISIIIVSYNTAEMTVAAIASVYETARDLNLEIFVLDNASSDGSPAAIAEAFPKADYPNLHLTVSTANLGFAAGNNRAAQAARGKYILLLNPDTVILPGAIQNLVAFAEKNPAARIWGSRNILGDGTLDLGSCWGRMSLWSIFCFAFGLSRAFKNSAVFNSESYGGWDRSTERQVDIITGCFFLVDMALWQQLSGFDERFFMYGEEADFCLRAKQLGAAPRFTPDAEIIHYVGASDTVRAARMSKTFSGKITLAKKHWPRWQVSLLRLLYQTAVLIRLGAYKLIGRLTRKPRHQAAAKEWGEVWKMRKQWRPGY